MKYEVRVADSYRWERARVGGRDFARRNPVFLAEHEITDEIWESALLTIEPVEEGDHGGSPLPDEGGPEEVGDGD